ncbi:MAG: hypothetical protein RL701_5184 [Pseudomonadota bacterium]
MQRLVHIFSAVTAVLSCSLGVGACGAEVAAPASRGAAGGATSYVDVPATGACIQTNLTRSCRCASALPGRQICAAGAWQTCECAPAADGGTAINLDGNNRTDIQFVWQKTAAGAEAGGCLPGNYEGTFGGIYWSYIATLAPIEDLAVPIANVDLPGAPSGFNFTVEPATGGETILKIKGVMNGTADLVFPFTANIEGELDCKTKTFNARMLNGKYSVLLEGLVAQDFVGVMTSRYDTRTHTFIEGVWDVWETSGVPPGTQAPSLPRDFPRDGFGGFGTFAAALPTNVTDPTLTPCPQDYACQSGPLGPNKFLCSFLLGPPGCTTDAECDAVFSAGDIGCLQTTAFSTCLKECKP